jgi:hypothetical protein
VDVHVKVAAATQELLRCDDMKSVLDTGDWLSHTSHVIRHTSYVTRHTSHVTRHTSHVTRHTSHVTGAYIAQTFVGATTARAFLHDRENTALL